MKLNKWCFSFLGIYTFKKTDVWKKVCKQQAKSSIEFLAKFCILSGQGFIGILKQAFYPVLAGSRWPPADFMASFCTLEGRDAYQTDHGKDKNSAPPKWAPNANQTVFLKAI